MKLNQKYIKTKDGQIIVFSEIFQHSNFSIFHPITAGFVSINATEKHEPTIACYGESISLGLKSDPEEDTRLAELQILGKLPF